MKALKDGIDSPANVMFTIGPEIEQQDFSKKINYSFGAKLKATKSVAVPITREKQREFNATVRYRANPT